MPFDRSLIAAPSQSGLQTDLPPWQIMDDAFQELNNAYVWRGRLRKRFGSILMGNSQINSRLSIALTGGVGVGITDPATGNATGTVPGGSGAIGQAFSIGTEIYYVYQANGAMYDTGATTTKTFNTATGVYNFVNAPKNMQIYFYPALPVMGLTVFAVGPINNQPSYAFDTKYAYVFTGGRWIRSVNAGNNNAPTWHGTDTNFFWATNWEGITPNVLVMFVSNFYVVNPNGLGTATDDPIWYFDGTNWFPLSYSPDALINPTNVQPLTVTRTTAGNNQIIANYVQTARIILPFKDRLVLLNTIENNANGATAFDPGDPTHTGITPTNYLTSTNTQFGNRARYSHNGSPLATNAWLENNQTYNPGATGVVVADGGGYVDAPTDEQIVTAEFIKDRLIVYFERSTWELVYTGNQILPFVWQKINTELGAESTFSNVPFDQQVLAIGNTGVHSCNGANVQRIDVKIPDNIFEIKVKANNNLRIAGIRDYFLETVYWSFVDANAQPQINYPNRVLLYNYRNNSWAYNDDSITAFGYFEQQSDVTWQTANSTWETYNGTWSSGVVPAENKQIIFGNQEGWVLELGPDESRNAPSLQITNITVSGGVVTVTAINHNLTANNPWETPGDYVALENLVGISFTNGFDNKIYRVQSTPDANTFTFVPNSIIGVYAGGGTIARVSNYKIWSKQWNPYIKEDRNFYLQRIDFAVETTNGGQVTVDYYPSSTNLSMLTEGGPMGTNMIMGTGILETDPYPVEFAPLEQWQTILWHPVYFQTTGTTVQIAIYMSDAQMLDASISWSDFVIEGMVLYTQRSGYYLR